MLSTGIAATSGSSRIPTRKALPVVLNHIEGPSFAEAGGEQSTSAARWPSADFRQRQDPRSLMVEGPQETAKLWTGWTGPQHPGLHASVSASVHRHGQSAHRSCSLLVPSSVLPGLVPLTDLRPGKSLSRLSRTPQMSLRTFCTSLPALDPHGPNGSGGRNRASPAGAPRVVPFGSVSALGREGIEDAQALGTIDVHAHSFRCDAPEAGVAAGPRRAAAHRVNTRPGTVMTRRTRLFAKVRAGLWNVGAPGLDMDRPASACRSSPRSR